MRTFVKYWLPVLLWVAVITVLSRSEFQSELTYRWLRAAVGFFLPEVSASTLLKINGALRKLAHVTEYFVLAVLVWRGLRRGAVVSWQWRWAWGTLALGLLLAALDELHQHFEPGRSASLADVGFDSLGVLLALLVVDAWQRARSFGTGPPPPL